MSNIETTHPSYVEIFPDWKMIRDFYKGPAHIRNLGIEYLPPTEGMEIDGMASGQLGYKAYHAYRERARVPDYVKEAVEIIVGLLHQKEAVIELPPELEYLRTRASAQGESLAAFHRRISVEQVTTGRLGVLADMPEVVVGPPQPTMAIYSAESIRNWDASIGTEPSASIQLVVLDESGKMRDSKFTWKDLKAYRVLDITDKKYRNGQFNDHNKSLEFNEEGMKTPNVRGKTLPFIPFTFINTKDLLPAVDEPPLKGLAELCKGIYQSEADYRWNLYMQAQDTLVVIGGIRNPSGAPGDPEALRTGAGSRIDTDVGGDAKYIGVSADGLAEQRLALEADRRAAQVKAGELIQNNGSQMESGQALSTRFNAQTATLNQIATTSAAGLENEMRYIAMWLGADPSKVKVTPNMEFIDFTLDGANFKALIEAKRLGFPMSWKSLHALAADRGLTVLDYITEMAEIEKDNKAMLDAELKKAKAMNEVAPTPAPTAPGTTAKPKTKPAKSAGKK